MNSSPFSPERGQLPLRHAQDFQTTSKAPTPGAAAAAPTRIATTTTSSSSTTEIRAAAPLPRTSSAPHSEAEQRRLRESQIFDMAEKDTQATLICQRWHLTSLDSFFNHAISSIDPDLKSSVRLKPAHYSEHLIRKLWYIARETDVPPDRVRRMLAQALFARLNDQGNKRNAHITVQDVSKVTKKIDHDLSRTSKEKEASPESGGTEPDNNPRPHSPKPREADTIIARGRPEDYSSSSSDNASPPGESLLENHVSLVQSTSPQRATPPQNGVPPRVSTTPRGSTAPRTGVTPNTSTTPRPVPSPRTENGHRTGMTPVKNREQPQILPAPRSEPTTRPEPIVLNGTQNGAQHSTPSVTRPVLIPKPSANHNTTPAPLKRTEFTPSRPSYSSESPVSRGPQNSSTPQSANRPWKRARKSMNAAETISTTINDLEYEMKVTTAKITVGSRRLDRARQSLVEEEENLASIKDFVAREASINKEISDHAALLTTLGKVHNEFPQILGGNAPTNNVGQGQPAAPPALFAELLASVSVHHDSLVEDIVAAKAELRDIEKTVLELRRQFTEAQNVFMKDKAELQQQKEQLSNYREALVALRTDYGPGKQTRA